MTQPETNDSTPADDVPKQPKRDRTHCRCSSWFATCAREYLLIVRHVVVGVRVAAVDRQDGARGMCEPATVGIVVPTGYSFNLDGTAIYLTMASLFIADAHGRPAVRSAEQLSTAGVHDCRVQGRGRCHRRRTCHAGCRPAEPPARTCSTASALIVGIDRFMSEVRALTNFSGNAVATVLVGRWTGTLDHRQMHEVLRRRQTVRRGRPCSTRNPTKPQRRIANTPKPGIRLCGRSARNAGIFCLTLVVRLERRHLRTGCRRGGTRSYSRG